ncbi:uncharacterized protein PGTG_02254 [Puccinia graminis f. sp. tritici CRL 75-36-700-3]|uniref:DUF6589 domain-containing protein n=1 Tax=Puccinia graminis f. sp. tritici (strain CRL 75-36-700-3 / race SCCL) TaxID=418459 RepID=E3JXL8_PUCGT|nr:uncharacterized protein PGTG_02254 [Puccinia graminis f. sp. tritici CRL 75-36-700-3]EFP76793.2 hypothetical protein PGTG_02254 [Puccinia graminis f. sp. tritici CRL 75-36-700-3]
MAMNHPVTDEKVLQVCKLLNSLPTKMTPKMFISRFLQSGHSDLPLLRGHWAGDKGIDSTMELVGTLRNVITKTSIGQSAWNTFIEAEAISILVKQEPPRGNYPNGGFHSSSTVGEEFFTPEAKEEHERQLTVQHMPFLYNILMGMLKRTGCKASIDEEEELAFANSAAATKVNVDTEVTMDSEDSEINVDPLTVPEEVSNMFYELVPMSQDRFHQRSQRIATTVTSMLAFARNRRQNGLQLHNSVRFFSTGISERVQEYLNYIGLSSARSTGMAALETLAKESADTLKEVVTNHTTLPIAPSICIDNIDIEQRVHQSSVGVQSSTFRGTWGYIHLPDKKLLEKLDLSEINLAAYNHSLKTVASMEIEPHMFLPTEAEEKIEIKVWKSQIARVLHQYIATPIDKESANPIDPPVVEQISHEAPKLHMLKLMDASDNSAEGVGQVFRHIIKQSGLSVKDFFGRFQPMDGDLGTVQNFNCLRSQRSPSSVPQNRLDNILFQLGGSHTLWNVASTIFTHHFGEPTDMTNCGAWQHLEALGFPSEKAIQKKDFTLMVNQMERIFEAMARSEAAGQECPKLSNTLLQLHDFSTVVEAKRSMRAGDVGRLLLIWKKWSLMSQALRGITNYSSYLPRMVLLLTVISPPSMSTYLKHNLLFSPTGRRNHFVAKDQWLEVQNYWLKFLFNRSGNGTNIDRLRDLLSPNIFLLQRMFHSLKQDCGAKLVRQSHKNILPENSILMFTQMANNRDILSQYSNITDKVIKKVDNTYVLGIKKMKKTLAQQGNELVKFKKHILHINTENEMGHADEGDEEEPRSADM